MEVKGALDAIGRDARARSIVRLANAAACSKQLGNRRGGSMGFLSCRNGKFESGEALASRTSPLQSTTDCFRCVHPLGVELMQHPTEALAANPTTRQGLQLCYCLPLLGQRSSFRSGASVRLHLNGSNLGTNCRRKRRERYALLFRKEVRAGMVACSLGSCFAFTLLPFLLELRVASFLSLFCAGTLRPNVSAVPSPARKQDHQHVKCYC